MGTTLRRRLAGEAALGGWCGGSCVRPPLLHSAGMLSSMTVRLGRRLRLEDLTAVAQEHNVSGKRLDILATALDEAGDEVPVCIETNTASVTPTTLAGSSPTSPNRNAGALCGSSSTARGVARFAYATLALPASGR